jgi:hypothetical protein
MLSKDERKVKRLIGKTVYLDLGQIGTSVLDVLGYDKNTKEVSLEYYNGHKIELDLKTFISQGGFDEK